MDRPDPPSAEPRDSTPRPNEAFWQAYLERGEESMRVTRHVFGAVPSDPRCRLCAVPFGGAGGRVMRLLTGRRPSEANPNLCSTCQTTLIKYKGGAEVDGSMLFADIRGSTALAERMSPADFKAFLDRFYRAASRAVIDHDGAIDKFVGDELVAMFYTALAGQRHPARAIATAQAILRATGHGTADGPWAPVGAGIHTGRVWFGAVGEGSHVELTALGDIVNTTARLAGQARTGEILVSMDAATAAGLHELGLERRSLDLKGKELPFEVVVVGVETAVTE